MGSKSEEPKAAEAEVERLRDMLGPFVVTAASTRMAMVFTDAKVPDNPIIFANDAFLALTGYTREEVLGQSFNFLMAHGADTDALARIQAEFEGSEKSGEEIRYRRKDGSEFWAALFISPVRDEAGDIVQYFASFIDLTAHKKEQSQSRMLIDELNHRVKNTLATVQSIVWQALQTGADPKTIGKTIESRLMALSRSHDLLTRGSWQSAGLGDLIADALEPFVIDNDRAKRVVLSGENIRFSPSAALTLGIAFNELATNAVKYGAFANQTGSILIEWKIEQTPQGNRLILFWREKGGPPVTPPVRQGFGSRVLERGLRELKGDVRLDYLPEGVFCTMSIPVPEPE
ncbi:HWE histidine kinase domain-containing protein [Microvirga sp. 2MCAF38]|uniref:HWE histidine kinase domain-containing protein n=1 Tax=Microvirga sp. 2MCAF38 TaxID=3232989 RepID=UPI003F9C89FA